MPITYITDIETTGIIQPRAIHCAILLDPDTTEVHSFADQPGFRPLAEYKEMVQRADTLIGHNICGYDAPQIRRLLGAKIRQETLIDTLLATRALWPDLREDDKAAGILPPDCIGRHSLRAWGLRLGVHKGEFGKTTDWQHWSPDMQEYCLQDCLATARLYLHILECDI